MAWTEASYFNPLGAKNFRDPVHKNDIFLTPLELKIVNTPEFQRLRGIKQLGSCEVVWHGATHNRFQHSLGTLFMVDRILHNADPEKKFVTVPRRIICRLFGLLHDIGHVPFGHTIEDERPAIAGHHTDRHRIEQLFSGGIRTALKEIEDGLDEKQKEQAEIGLQVGKRKIDSLASLLTELIAECKGETDQDESKVPPELEFYTDVVGNTICADLFDYLRRDTYATGLSRSYDDKIMSDFAIKNGHLVLDILSDKPGRAGTRTEIIHLLQIRYTLAERVYFNKTKMWASGMISKAVEMAQLTDQFLFDKRDEELLYLLEHPEQLEALLGKEKDTRSKTSLSIPEFKSVSDTLGSEYASLWSHVWKKCKKEKEKDIKKERDLKGASELVKAYRTREIFRPVYLAIDTNQNIQDLFKSYFHDFKLSNFRYAMEMFLADACKLEKWQVIICCPNPNMNLKFANPIIGPFSGDEYMSVQKVAERNSDDPQIRLLIQGARHVCDNHKALWQFAVLAPAEVEGDKRRKLAGLCRDVFKLTNRASEFAGPDGNITNIRIENISEAYKEVYGLYPRWDEIRAIQDQRLKLGDDDYGPGLYTKEDYLKSIKEMRDQGITNQNNAVEAKDEGE